MYQGTVYIVSNCILYMMIGLAVSLVCERRFSFQATFAIQAMSSVFNILFCNLLPVFSEIRAFLGFTLVVGINTALHKGKLPLRILYSALAVMCMLFSELLMVTIVPKDLAVTGELYAQHPVLLYSVVLFVNAVVLAVFVVLTRTIQSRYRGLQIGKEWMLFLLFPISQLISFHIFFENYIALSSNVRLFMLAIAVYLIADIALFAAIRVTAKNAMLQARNEILEEEVSFQKDFYEQLSASYEGIRKMRHDIDNHFYAMQSMLDLGKVEEASEYAKKVAAEDTTRLKFAECRNMVAASYLEKKSEDFDRLGIRFEPEVYLPAGLSIPNTDLICVFGNLLDNAQEACLQADDPCIALKTVYRAPYLTISCRNTAKDTAGQGKSRRIPELERGVGFTILNDLANRYDGSFLAEQEDGWFKTEIILKSEENDAC